LCSGVTKLREGVGHPAHPLVLEVRCVRFAAVVPSDRFGASSRLDDVDRLTSTLLAKLHRTGDEGKERVIATATNAVAGMEVRATLAHDDLAGVDCLAAETLDAKELGVRVAPVTRRRCTLFVCHVSACLWFWGLSDERTTGRKEAQASIAVTLIWVEC